MNTFFTITTRPNGFAITEARKVCRNGLLALGLVASLASAASSVCYDSKGIEDAGFARIVDAEGKKHKFSVFILGEEDIHEFGEFVTSRKTVAMSPDRTFYVKVESGIDTIPNVKDCPKRARKALKL